MSPTGTGKLTQLPTDITQGGKPILVDARWASIVGWIARTFNVKVSSGYRDPVHNESVGGATHSDHLSGSAVDFVGPGQSALYAWATKLQSAGKLPYVEPQSQAKDHVHISFARPGATADAAAVRGAGDSSATPAAATSAGSGCLIPLLVIVCFVLDFGLRAVT